MQPGLDPRILCNHAFLSFFRMCQYAKGRVLYQTGHTPDDPVEAPEADFHVYSYEMPLLQIIETTIRFHSAKNSMPFCGKSCCF